MTNQVDQVEVVAVSNETMGVALEAAAQAAGAVVEHVYNFKFINTDKDDATKELKDQPEQLRFNALVEANEKHLAANPTAAPLYSVQPDSNKRPLPRRHDLIVSLPLVTVEAMIEEKGGRELLQKAINAYQKQAAQVNVNLYAPVPVDQFGAKELVEFAASSRSANPSAPTCSNDELAALVEVFASLLASGWESVPSDIAGEADLIQGRAAFGPKYVTQYCSLLKRRYADHAVQSFVGMVSIKGVTTKAALEALSNQVQALGMYLAIQGTEEEHERAFLAVSYKLDQFIKQAVKEIPVDVEDMFVG